jgi:sugar phosphate isomerase/epimerase
MEGLPWLGERPWALDERIEHIAAAGFDGVAVDLGAREAPSADALRPLVAAAGLRCRVLAFVDAGRPLHMALDYCRRVGAESVVVCGQVFPEDVAKGAAIVRDWMDEAAAAGVPFELETHRYTITNDLGYTLRLLDAIGDLRISADLSHYVVGNELPDAGDERTDAAIAAILARATSLQGRIATRGQVQISSTFPQHAATVARFRGWWADGFRSWRQRSPAGAECVFICELGTLPYPVTGPDGAELSDRWIEAQRYRDWAHELFGSAAAS